MKQCKFCHEPLSKKIVQKKFGYFCSEAHAEDYLASLSNDEYVQLLNSFCACQDEG